MSAADLYTILGLQAGRASASQVVSGRHRAGKQRVQQLEIFQVNCGAVVKNLVATALCQLAFKHHGAVKIQFYVTSTNVKILKDKESSNVSTVRVTQQ